MPRDRGLACRYRRGESREHACRRHSRQALCGSAEYEMKADYVLGSLSEIPALIRRINAAASEEHALR